MQNGSSMPQSAGETCGAVAATANAALRSSFGTLVSARRRHEDAVVQWLAAPAVYHERALETSTDVSVAMTAFLQAPAASAGEILFKVEEASRFVTEDVALDPASFLKQVLECLRDDLVRLVRSET